ncbi:TolC family outer membrane protein [Undibacterium fentianense]|uniref:TolC family outer membrane protein n=1 Tax=Undibacterium fentianense TaxID=2828728 RepID=A0A941DYP9_9BURK|nr:TolC family outer membrane protein [Undibacterium fentianense]MBR7799899.1 TolC family outer membrane protein [Undibacterium fentianense]
MSLNLKQISLAISLASTTVWAQAQTQTLKEAAQKAILTNPEIQAKWHAFQSTSSSRDAAFGAYLPNVTVSADAGRDNRDNRLGKSEMTRNSTAISLNQMIYDGFLTSSQVKQMDHLKQVRFFELQDTSENITLEVVRAYADVVRFRKLVSLSEDNYVRHRAVFEQIQAKSKAGVSRRVDLEQISGRLALAEANLVTETSNLHDVSARFQRLVGAMPAKDLENLSTLIKASPSSVKDALNTAFTSNPAIMASLENIESVNFGVNSRKSAYQPRLDFKARAERGNNIDYVSGRTNNNTAEVVMSWNIFNGGSDKARVQEAANQLNLARDLRDKTCRDVRQTVAIAFNDTKKLSEQLNFLDQHQLSIEKARDAYRQQFDIGQRSLLDLLDTENELFQAKRSFANAEIDLFLAYARTQAGMGKLYAALGLERRDDGAGSLKSLDSNANAAAANCPIEAPEIYTINKAQLDQRAMEGLVNLEPIKPTTKVTPLENNVPVAKASEPTKDHVAVSRTAILNSLKSWRDAWVNMNADAYFNFYSQKYTSRESWKTARRARLMNAQKISLDLSDIKFTMQDSKHATTSFQQDYRSANYQDSLQKTLYWEETNGKWQIVNESVSGPKAKQW